MVSLQEIEQLIPPVNEYDHCLGDPAAKVTLVEYGDYQCLECQTAHSIIQTIQRQWGDRLRFVFRHFPQTDIHPEAFHAAEAAEAAASQNRFWQMHVHLLEHQGQLSDSHLVEYAIHLSLDINRFLSEMASDSHIERVQADIRSATENGVTKTPTFFINGLRYANEQGLEELHAAIEAACLSNGL